jgi:DNA-binding NarL/FixJ family response regulator
MKYNLIIADDHKMFLEGLLSILNTESNYNILFTADHGGHVQKYISINTNENIDLVITDVTMPEVDGIALNEWIKKLDRNIKTLVVSMHNSPKIIDKLMESNVDGYLQKNAQKEEFLKAIETILRGEKYFSREIKDIYLKNKFEKNKEKEIKLTKREVDVISLIAEEFTSQEIADKLFLSKHTIESYRKNLITKLNVRNLAGLTKYAIKKGYVSS